MSSDKYTQQEPLGYTVTGLIARAGGAAHVGRLCGISTQAVLKWDRRIPDQHAQDVAVAAGLPLEIVRPDMARSGHEMAIRYAQEKQVQAA